MIEGRTCAERASPANNGMISNEVAPTPAVKIPFVRPALSGSEIGALRDAVDRRYIAGDNQESRSAEAWLRKTLPVSHALLTPSGTAALELAAILAGLTQGDEVIMPSFTFSSTANAVVLRGAIPVFVDVRSDTLNIDADQIRPAITDKTRAVVVVHYAGVTCDMDRIMKVAREAGLVVIEDAAQALLSRYRGRAAGTLADMAAFSFHETKNIQCGEGGAFTCDSADYGVRAEIVREKGTNRAAFFRGEIDKYSWIDVGSSYLPNELSAAFLGAQLDGASEVTARRMAIWSAYDDALSGAAAKAGVLTPQIPADCEHNAHIYHLRMTSLAQRTRTLAAMRREGVQATSHYVPLHSAPAGRRYGRTHGVMTHTNQAGDCLLRLPLWPEMTDAEVSQVIDAFRSALAA
jgi:dTDP-4-amino-4,6-dideoxygalactose transaminase